MKMVMEGKEGVRKRLLGRLDELREEFEAVLPMCTLEGRWRWVACMEGAMEGTRKSLRELG